VSKRKHPFRQRRSHEASSPTVSHNEAAHSVRALLHARGRAGWSEPYTDRLRQTLDASRGRRDARRVGTFDGDKVTFSFDDKKTGAKFHAALLRAVKMCQSK